MNNNMPLAWRSIPLSRGLCTLVDGEDFEQLNQYKWCALKAPSTYYAVRNTQIQKSKRRTVYMHREILGLSKGVEGDHRNGYGLDNRKANLRSATHQQNMHNSKRQKEYSRHNCSSRYKGISWHKASKKWHAYIRFNDKLKYLGLFNDEIEAAKAYDRKAIELFGEFAHTNF